jgi:hypothetical protein
MSKTTTPTETAPARRRDEISLLLHEAIALSEVFCGAQNSNIDEDTLVTLACIQLRLLHEAKNAVDKGDGTERPLTDNLLEATS